MTLNVLNVIQSFPFNHSILPKESFVDYLQYCQHKELILAQVIQDFLAQSPDNHQWLLPKILTSKPAQNPTNLTNPYWQWLVKNNVCAYDLIKFVPTESSKPLWGMGRMGQSSTLLPDGRAVLIGGEFEDSYDNMFLIYNDIIVKHPNGDIEIFGYPKAIFPPTDFHTATLVGDKIYIIGGMGYYDQRHYGSTPIFALDIHSYAIERIESRNQIGWISDHQAVAKSGQIIVKGGNVMDDAKSPIRENIDTWAFNPKTLIWQNVTKNKWQGFYVQRKDNDWLHLFEYSNLAFYEQITSDNYHVQFDELTQILGCKPNLTVYHSLFSPPIAHEIEDSLDESGRFVIIRIDGIKVRYIDDGMCIQVYIEGILSDEKLAMLQDNLRHKLSKLENMACEVKLLPL